MNCDDSWIDISNEDYRVYTYSADEDDYVLISDPMKVHDCPHDGSQTIISENGFVHHVQPGFRMITRCIKGTEVSRKVN